MQNPEDIVRKLLALARGSNEHEAALAAQRASEIALKYGIDLLNIQAPSQYKDEVVTDSKKETWVTNIIAGIAKLNACKLYTQQYPDGTSKYRLIGKPHAINIVNQISQYLISEVKRRNRQEIGKYNLSQQERSAYRKDFRLLASQHIFDRCLKRLEELREQQQTTGELSGSTALVVANYFDQEKKNIEDWMNERGFKLKAARQVSTTIRSLQGMKDGAKAGKDISLNDQLTNRDLKKLA